MQAIHISSFLPISSKFSCLETLTVTRPIQKEGELLVRVSHVAIQQVDLLYAKGQHQNNNVKHGHIHPPFTLGLDFSGVVISLPQSSTDGAFKDGSGRSITISDRVMGSKLGAFAEYLAIPSKQVQIIPETLGNVDAAALVGGAVSYGAVVQEAGVRSGQWVLVSGVPGGLGVVACQIAKALGARVIALASNQAKASALEAKVGADYILSSANESGEPWSQQVMKITEEAGVNAVIDNVGIVDDSIRCLKYGGKIILVGFAGRNGAMEKIAMNKILLKGAYIIGYVSLK